jgi:transcriptional regulator with XRE-family HTH domain
MSKSKFSSEYSHFLSLLRSAREGRGITQAALAKSLDRDQTYVSKCESGERRVDVVELSHFCKALGIPLYKFIKELEQK